MGGGRKIGGGRLFEISKEGAIVFFGYKDKGGSYDSARFIRSQLIFKKVRLVNQLNRMVISIVIA